ncbi:MAG: FUSC family protein [Methylobacillus sp.]|jgi:uncharacterized membrane protein YccC|nr:FUSC family protein [Methylobacillus sp.]
MSVMSLPRSKPLLALLAAGRDWLHADAPVIAHVLKVLFACLLAAWVSLMLELDQPRTAMMTVTIVLMPRSGMVFAKSYYRLLGTLVGVFVSFVFVGLFAQERILFLVCMAIWIGICTAGSMIYRNFQSYAFVLAGYTLCIVGLPATVNPAHAFDIGVSRVTEIMIGLVCAALVSDLILPQRMWDTILDSVRRCYGDFSDMLRLTRLDSGGETFQPAFMRFIGDVFSLESYRESAMLENDDSRAYRLILGRLNAEFIEVSTSFHAFERLMRRQQKNNRPEVVAALQRIYEPLRGAMSLEGRSARTEEEAVVIENQMTAFCADFDRAVAAARQQLPPDAHMPGFETGVDLLRRLSDELRVYTTTYASLAKTRATTREQILEGEPPRLKMHFDPLAVALAGARGALALAIMATFWIALDWRSGLEAITIGVVASTLFASRPSPARTVWYFMIGALIGTIFGYLTNFMFLPRAQGFEMLALAVAPAILIASWVTTHAKYATIGSGIFIVSLSHLGFNHAYNADPVAFVNDAIALLIAVLLASVMYRLIDLGSSDWLRQRTARALRRLVVSACRDTLALRRIHLESGARDLVQRSGSANRLAEPQDRVVIEWLFSVLEIGNAVILLREQMRESDATLPREPLAAVLEAVARLHEKPSHENRLAAIAEIRRAFHALDDAEPRDAAHGRLMTTLHFIDSALSDEKSILTGTPAPTGENA